VQIAVHMGRGHTAVAIDAAVKYLDVFQTDSTVWDQLHRLYLDAGQFEQAQFCLEEVVLAAPGNVVSHLKLADLLYLQGGVKLQAARGYYAKAVELTKGESVRALYGVLACAAGGAAPLDGEGGSGGEGAGLEEAVRQRLRRMYELAAPVLLPGVDAVLTAQR
jgi:ER membrane protein complex subunit 2